MSKTRANAWGGVLPQFDLDIPMPRGAAVPRSDTHRGVGPRGVPAVRSGGATRLAGKDEEVGRFGEPTGAQANSRVDGS